MAAFGRTDFPEIPFSEALEIAEKIRSKNIKTVAALASELGYSPKSHGGIFFYKRVALSKHYRILEASKTTITFTNLGERIVDSLSDSDRESAIRDAILGVPIVKNLYESLGTSYHPDDFKPKLAEVTGLSPSEVATYASRIESVYEDAIGFLGKGTGTPRDHRIGHRQSAAEDAEVERIDALDAHTKGGATFDKPVRTLQLSNHYLIKIVLDPEVIDEAVALLNALKAHEEEKRKPKGTEAAEGS
jgi:hypothetical protein